MKIELEKEYDLNICSIIKRTDKVLEINDEKESYLLKKYDNRLLENIYSRIEILNIYQFAIPIKNKENRYFLKIDGSNYCLFKKYYEEDFETKDIKLSYYVKAISYLHKKSAYSLKTSDSFFKDCIAYLDNRREKIKNELVSRITLIEHQGYHSPSDWYFYMNFYRLMNAIKESERYTTLLEEEWENLKVIKLSLTYQNFSFEHILPKENIIVSLDKMAYAPSIYDLVDLIEKTYQENIDVSNIILQYEEENKLELYEKYWILALLFIPIVKRDENEIEDINLLNIYFDKLGIIESLASSFSLEES